MHTKLTCAFILSLSLLFRYKSEAQNRLPVHARIAITQKMLEKPECSVNIQELKFTGARSHSIGLGFGLDFGLNRLDSTQVQWILQASGNLFSVPLNYNARMPKDIHGFDYDVSWDFERYAAGFETSVGLIRQTQLNDKWDIRLGLGANIQDMYINSSKLQHSAVITQNGIAQAVQVVGTTFDPFTFGSPPRQKQDLQFNAVYSVGFSTTIDAHTTFLIDLRVCHSGQQILEPFNFMFGDVAEFKYQKSFVGIDLAYRFSINRFLSQPGI
mgnify:FL=1